MLKNIRDQIDLIDAKLLKLLNERMEQAIIAGRFKSKIEDSERERKILSRIEADFGELIGPEFCKDLFKSIFKESKRLQQKDFQVIAFQGEHGAYSEMAAKSWQQKLITIPCDSFADVFEGIGSGLYDYGIVPVENTLGGVVGQVNELLMKTELYVVGAVEQPIHHCLLSFPGADHREIRKVYSHTQAIAQCKYFLERNKLEAVPYYDTAGAARRLFEKQETTAAVIASQLAARLYRLEVIKENIEDLKTNRTRFLVLAKQSTEAAGEKCSILFATAHKAGTLFKVLDLFARANINLTRIESMPKEPGSYAFFLDFEGSDKDQKVKDILHKMKAITRELRVLGCYKERKVK